ncbi:MAG: 1-acyl-sn-glycerol-3-phosphate acyltransferase [Verrucomicrobia bacterium]|nr:1-acyl-sn-glycerol-3-phosphate acyltransferase [Verrucomicrobiota bacterium]
MPASFSQPVEIPLWLAWLGGLLAAWALISLTLWPLVRGHFRRRALLLVERMNERLKLRIPTYKMANREALIGRLVADPRLLEAMNEEQRATGESAAVIARKVERYAREIVPAFRPYLYFRVGSWLARAVARSLYRVRLGHADAGTMAVTDPQASVVFVMNHRSNMDYILLAHLAADQVALSYAVGEWAQVWPVSQIVRALGAFFVRRGSGNALYRRVLERYVQLATEGGIVQVVYPEGGLTRDGHLRPPKLGLLDYMARAFDPTGPRDLVFVPVAVNYDRVLEDRNLLSELDPQAPRLSKGQTVARLLGWIWRNLRLRLRGGWYRFGYAVVNVGQAVSLRSYAAARGIDFRTLPRDERVARVEALAQELMRAVGAIVPVVPAALLARVFVEAGDRALDDLGWKAAAETLLERLESAGAQIYVPRRDRAYALEAGLRTLTLRRLIRAQPDGTLLADPAPENARVLRYYANSIDHLLPPLAQVAPDPA